MIKEHMVTFKRLQLVKEMITQPVVYLIMIILKSYYEMIAIDLSKQHVRDADLNAKKKKKIYLKSSSRWRYVFHY